MNDENENRWIWAPMIGHGVALVTLGGIVGNVPSPDTALYALAPSITCFGIGVLAGAISASTEGEFYNIKRLTADFEARNHDLMERRAHLISVMSDIKEATQPENTTIASNLSSKFKLRALEAHADVLAAMHDSLRRDMDKVELWLKRGKLRSAFIGIAKGASLALFALGLMKLLMPISSGELHLEKRETVRGTQNGTATPTEVGNTIPPTLGKSRNSPEA